MIYKLVQYGCKIKKDSSKTRNAQAHVNLILIRTTSTHQYKLRIKMAQPFKI